MWAQECCGSYLRLSESLEAIVTRNTAAMISHALRTAPACHDANVSEKCVEKTQFCAPAHFVINAFLRLGCQEGSVASIPSPGSRRKDNNEYMAMHYSRRALTLNLVIGILFSLIA